MYTSLVSVCIYGTQKSVKRVIATAQESTQNAEMSEFLLSVQLNLHPFVEAEQDFNCMFRSYFSSASPWCAEHEMVSEGLSDAGLFLLFRT